MQRERERERSKGIDTDARMTATEETEPLISASGLNPNRPHQRITYRAISFEEKGSSESSGNGDKSLKMKQLSTTAAKSRINFHEEIVYTWSDVNVYASAKQERLIDRIFCRRRKSFDRRHILKDGNMHGKLVVEKNSMEKKRHCSFLVLTFIRYSSCWSIDC